jgi:uncharacterized membrane protein YeaQ/YmgE (transglycosylase-associated protein family)
MGYVIFAIVGAIAGFVASKVLTGKGMGLIWDIVVGVVGAFVGSWLAGLVGIKVATGTFSVSGILAAFVGAVILILIFRAVTGRGRMRA